LWAKNIFPSLLLSEHCREGGQWDGSGVPTNGRRRGGAGALPRHYIGAGRKGVSLRGLSQPGAVCVRPLRCPLPATLPKGRARARPLVLPAARQKTNGLCLPACRPAHQQLCASGEAAKPDPDVAIIGQRLANVKHKILVLSGKGGVGKSTFSAQVCAGRHVQPCTHARTFQSVVLRNVHSGTCSWPWRLRGWTSKWGSSTLISAALPSPL
jgi:hypothetical protein